MYTCMLDQEDFNTAVLQVTVLNQLIHSENTVVLSWTVVPASQMGVSTVACSYSCSDSV